MPLLEVRDLHTHFFTSDGVVKAVDGVSFDLLQGESLGLVGESGSGKSATALSILRLVPDPPGKVVAGQVLFDGADILNMGRNELRSLRGRQIAMVFQDPTSSLNPLLTVGRQIGEVLESHQEMDRAEVRHRTIELLELVGIPDGKDRLGSYPHQFSGGMRQRVMIAMAVACNPRLIIADEPTTALDVTTQAQILDLLKKLARTSLTAFLLITHDLGVIANMTERVLVMYAGRIVEKATTRELFANPRMPYTWGLLRSIPRTDVSEGSSEDGSRQQLVKIEGLQPDLIAPPAGCRFEPRCPYRREICREKDPELTPIPDADIGHEARCWGTQDVDGGGWLVGIDSRTELGDPRIVEAIRMEAARTVAVGYERE